MLASRGMTLIEIIVVMIIIAIGTVVLLPSFTVPLEHAKAVTAQNILLNIYSGQKNYFNNNKAFCFNTSTPSCDTLVNISNSLNLSVQGDGSYAYACTSDPSGFACTATRVNGVLGMTIKNAPISLINNSNPNCVSSNPGWCP